MALEATELRMMSQMSRGKDPGPAASLFKIRGTEILQRLHDLTHRAIGNYGLAMREHPSATITTCRVRFTAHRVGEISQLAQAQHLRRIERDTAQHHRQSGARPLSEREDRMDIEFTEEQELLRSSVQRMLRDEYDFDARRKIVRERRGIQPQAVAGLRRARPARRAVRRGSSGGLGGGALSTMIIMQEFGRRLVVEPFFETVVLAGGLLERLAHRANSSSVSSPTIIAGCGDLGAGLDSKRSRLRSADGHDHGAARRQGLLLAGREGRRHRGALGGQSDRLGAHLRRRRVVTASACSSSTAESANLHLQSFKTIDGRRAAEISARRRAGESSSGEEGEGVAALEACATAPSRRCAPKRSAQWAS